MRLRLRARLIAGYLGLVIVIGGATIVLIERTFADALVRDLDGRMVDQATAIGEWLAKRGEPDKLAPRLAWVTAADVVIIGADGIVRGDSAHPGNLGRPVGDAPEVAAARRLGVGRARRQVARGGPAMYLVAVRTADRRVIRVAVPLAHVTAAGRQLRGRVLWIGAIGLAAAALLGLGAIRAVTRPLQAMTRTAERLARGDYAVAPPVPGPARDELDLLARTLALLAGEIQARITELTAERDRSTAVVDALVEGVVAVDRDGRIVLANRAAAGLVGDVAPGAPVPAPLAAVLRGDGEVELAGRAVRVASRPLPATGGAVVVLYDVTQLRALDRVRRDFLASAAHELRTPVTAISGYAETLLGPGVDPASQREFLGAIHRNSERIARLVADLLELERLGARPARVVDRAPIAVAPIVANAIATAEAAAGRRGGAAAFAVDVPADLEVLGDRDGLEHVIQNLVDNAVVHGGGRVRVEARRDGGVVVVRVADHGPGIAADHQPRIFERFYRTDPGRGRASGGSGLGLAIVEQHVAAMGGTIRVDSAPGQGATFVVELDAAP
jgi:two-component system, OmpR family, phosphate regulon sensor histidine kinase PhoR